MAASTLTYEYLVDDRESSVDVWRRWEERQRKERGEPPRPSTPARPTLNDEEERRPGDAEQEGGTQGGEQGGEQGGDTGREQATDATNEADDVKGISMVELEQVNDQRETSLDVWRRYEEKRLREQQAKAVSGQEGEVNGATDGRRETTAPEGWCGSRKRKESPARDDESPSKAQKLHRQDSLERAAVAGAEELAQGIIA
ncbi:hypothetical protein DB88DRAFT_181810 [Papiliotrema laurentii]|uniref:Uncharacterized protein n=1 Tax=Papiliotrema laurentii TaxID=5418 RepID=A0AAD9L8R7_PAPLA|nr:hypothetical protein DB88DRAFT_181810 [Papiliotrema laurentii]